mmetsp:Transcript_23894/g.66410  ORF Transcript_23894/g.66410 Transcript_23894/m.66410 type:complete len:502 (+) Transcript_23894:24-1529(+)
MAFLSTGAVLARKKADDGDAADNLGARGAHGLKHACLSLRRRGRWVLGTCLASAALLAILGAVVQASDSQVEAASAREPSVGQAPVGKLSLHRAARRATIPAGGPVQPPNAPNDTTPIHVVISAFRDGERCARTIGFALEKAQHPDRVHFRVLQAVDEKTDTTCANHFVRNQLRELCKLTKDRRRCYSNILDRIRMWTIPKEEAMGPAHQRGVLNERLDFESTEALCMTIDSHMDFRMQWDALMIADWLATRNEFAVLTSYPMSTLRNQDQVYSTCHVDLCGYWLEDGIPRGRRGGNLPNDPSGVPYLTMNWAAGYSFHRCHADRNVPVDPLLKWIFTGEEISRAVRLWTHGYDLYLPSMVAVYHDYSAAKQEFWRWGGVARVLQKKRSHARLRTLLRLDGPSAAELAAGLGDFGVGSQRTLEQYVAWSRLDFGTKHWDDFLRSKNLTVVGDKRNSEGPHDFCQTLRRVPVANEEALYASILSGGPVREKIPAPVIMEPPL